MRVLTKKPGLSPNVVEIADGLTSMQGVVGGNIESVPIEAWMTGFRGSKVDLFVNEDGKNKGLDWNFPLKHPDTGKTHDMVAGPVLFCSTDDEGNSISLTDDQIELICKEFDWSPGLPD